MLFRSAIGYNSNNQINVAQVESVQCDGLFHSQGKFSLGLGWDISSEKRIDLDASVICFNTKLCACSIVYFGNNPQGLIIISYGLYFTFIYVTFIYSVLLLGCFTIVTSQAFLLGPNALSGALAISGQILPRRPQL